MLRGRESLTIKKSMSEYFFGDSNFYTFQFLLIFENLFYKGSLIIDKNEKYSKVLTKMRKLNK